MRDLLYVDFLIARGGGHHHFDSSVHERRPNFSRLITQLYHADM